MDTRDTPARTLTPAPVPTDTATSTPDPFEEDGAHGGAALGSSTVGGRTLALSPNHYRTDDAELLVRFDAPATRDHPARLRAHLRHRDGGATDLPFEQPPFVPRTRFDHDPRDAGPTHPAAPDRLFLVPTPGTDIATAVPSVELAGGDPGVWRLASAPTDWLPERVERPTTGPLTATFHLVAEPGATAPPTGRYRTRAGDRRLGRLTAWDAERPGPTSDSRFPRDRSVPTLPGRHETRWFHEATRRTSVYLEPDAERLDPPGAVQFTLVNHSREPVGAGDTTVYRLEDGRWYGLGSLFRRGAPRLLQPGDRLRRLVGLAHGPAGDLPSGQYDVGLGHLGGGTYAVAFGTTRGEYRPAALVALDAPPVTVRPTGDARSSRDGSLVRVSADPPRQEKDADPQTLVLDRLPIGDRTATPQPTAADATGGRLRRLLREQAMRSRGLRNTLGFLEEGVDRVRLRTTDDAVRRALRRVSRRTGGRRFRFAGGRFRLTVDATHAGRSDDEAGDGTGTGTPS